MIYYVFSLEHQSSILVLGNNLMENILVLHVNLKVNGV